MSRTYSRYHPRHRGMSLENKIGIAIITVCSLVMGGGMGTLIIMRIMTEIRDRGL